MQRLLRRPPQRRQLRESDQAFPHDTCVPISDATPTSLEAMTDLKAQLKADLTSAMKQRDELTTATIRMLLTAVTNEEVAPGRTERELSDDEVLKVINREAK